MIESPTPEEDVEPEIVLSTFKNNKKEPKSGDNSTRWNLPRSDFPASDWIC